MAGKRSLSDAESSGGPKKRVLLSGAGEPPASNGDVDSVLEVRLLIDRACIEGGRAELLTRFVYPTGVQEGGDMAPDARIQETVRERQGSRGRALSGALPLQRDCKGDRGMVECGECIVPHLIET
jgi:hypothetical protein